MARCISGLFGDGVGLKMFVGNTGPFFVVWSIAGSCQFRVDENKVYLAETARC